MILPDKNHMTSAASACVAILCGGMHSAFAHVGHLGEVAGHGHLVGAVLGIAAAAMAAMLAAKARATATEDEDDTADSNDISEPEGEPADA
jgi:hypothetical protein